MFPILCVLSLFCCASESVANEMNDLLSMSMEQIMSVKVETASRHAEELADAPANMLVISRREMRLRHYHSLIDVLEDLPGLHIQHHTSSTSYHRISWRGLYGSNKFLLLLDGVRITDPGGDSITIANNFSLEAIDRIEVVYGPASALYGADAAAGVINLISRDVTQRRGELALGSGSTHRMRGAASLQVPLGKTRSLLLSGHGFRDDTADLSRYYPTDFTAVDARTFGGTVVVPAASREAYVSPVAASSGYAKLHLLPGFDMGVYHNRERHLSSIGEKPSGVIYDPAAFWQQDITTLYARYKRLLGNNIESITLLDGSRLEVAPSSAFRNRYTDFQMGYQYMRNDRLELEQQLAWNLNDHMNLTMGISLGSYHSIPKTPDTPLPVNPAMAVSGQLMYYPNTNNSVPITLYDLRYNQYGIFVQHNWRINRHWSTTTGLRYDRDSRYGGSWNPRLSIVWRPVNSWAYKLMYGEAFRAPSTVETHEVYGSFSGAQNAAGQYQSGFFHLANPYLKPEKSRTLELSAQGTSWRNIYVAASIYRAQVNNVIFAAKNTGSVQIPTNAAIGFVETNQNIGDETFYGGELYVHHEHTWEGNWQSRIWASYSYVDGSISSGAGSIASELPYVARQHVRLGFSLGWGAWQLMSNSHFVGKSNINKADPLNPALKLKVPGYSLYDLHFGWRNAFQLGDIELSIFNVFDRRYTNASSGGIKFTGSQQQPRSFAIAMKVPL